MDRHDRSVVFIDRDATRDNGLFELESDPDA